MRASVFSVGRWLWTCLLCLACEQSASLGNVCADPDTRCEEVKVDGETYYANNEGARGTFDEYPALEPAWIRSKTSDGAALADGSRLSAGEPGSLWIFEPSAQGVRVLDVDEAGELREQALVTQPVPVRDDGSLSMELTHDAPDPRGPLLVVRSWPEIACGKGPSPSREPTTKCYGYDQQILVFDADPSAPPRRTTPPPGLLASRDGNVVRASAGDDLFAADRALTRYDARGEVRWTQASAVPAHDEDELRGNATMPAAALAALEGDRVAYLPFAGQLTPQHQAEYWLLDGSGAVLEAHEVPARGLVRTALFHSPSNDALIAADTSHGDLVLMGIRADDSVYTFIVPREDYTFQELLGASTDSAGTLYAVTRAGGDEPEELHTLVCRLVAAREGGCFRVADVPRIVDIQGTTPGVLYTLSRDGSLRRFEFGE